MCRLCAVSGPRSMERAGVVPPPPQCEVPRLVVWGECLSQVRRGTTKRQAFNGLVGQGPSIERPDNCTQLKPACHLEFPHSLNISSAPLTRCRFSPRSFSSVSCTVYTVLFTIFPLSELPLALSFRLRDNCRDAQFPCPSKSASHWNSSTKPITDATLPNPSGVPK